MKSKIRVPVSRDGVIGQLYIITILAKREDYNERKDITLRKANGHIVLLSN